MDNKKIFLQHTEFEINFIYGFIVRPLINREFDDIKTIINQKSNRQIRDGWISHYNLNVSSNAVVQWVDFSENEKFVITNESKDWPTAKKKLSGHIQKTLTICKDGVGTITLCFKVANDIRGYRTSDILRLLLSVPKTLHQRKEDWVDIRIPTLHTPPKGVKKDNWNNFSKPLKLFIKTMLEDMPKSFPKWNILFSREEKIRLLNDLEKSTDDYSIPVYEDYKFNTDPQIPYIFVFSKIPFKQYKNAFIEADRIEAKQYIKEDEIDKYNDDDLLFRIRSCYSNEIAAILGRWLNERNINMVSNEFRELRRLMSNNAFINQYINALIFTTYSGLVTLSLSPDLSILDDNDSEYLLFENNISSEKRLALLTEPIKVTYSAILRCLEISRMRWHQAFWLNNSLGKLISSVAGSTVSAEFLDHYDTLVKLEQIVASHLENPTSNLWDATVGSNISEFLQQQVIQQIENEISDKLSITRDLINDCLKSVTAQVLR